MHFVEAGQAAKDLSCHERGVDVSRKRGVQRHRIENRTREPEDWFAARTRGANPFFGLDDNDTIRHGGALRGECNGARRRSSRELMAEQNGRYQRQRQGD